MFVRYCDGGSYSGNADVSNGQIFNGNVYTGRSLFFRGQRNRDGIVSDLLSKHGMSTAVEVLVSGCSAGGLGVMLGVDKIKADIYRMNKNTTVRGLVDSGVFVDYSHGGKDFEGSNARYNEALSLDGALDYSAGMRRVFNMMNISSGTDIDCLEAYKNDTAKCVFAENIGHHIDTPLFFLQSRYDTWQIAHILGTSHTKAVNMFGDKVTDIVKSIVSSNRSVRGMHHGGFVNSCEHHCTISVIPGSTSVSWPWHSVFSQWMEPDGVGISSSPMSSFEIQNKSYPCQDCCSELGLVHVIG